MVGGGGGSNTVQLNPFDRGDQFGESGGGASFTELKLLPHKIPSCTTMLCGWGEFYKIFIL